MKLAGINYMFDEHENASQFLVAMAKKDNTLFMNKWWFIMKTIYKWDDIFIHSFNTTFNINTQNHGIFNDHWNWSGAHFLSEAELGLKQWEDPLHG